MATFFGAQTKKMDDLTKSFESILYFFSIRTKFKSGQNRINQHESFEGFGF